MDLQKWAENINKITYNKWKKHYTKWRRGFEVFYSPVCENPPIMILTLNPGGSVKDFEKSSLYKQFQNDDFSLPKTNHYTNDHKMSKAVRKFLGKHIELLGKSVVMPVLFFRSKSTRQWNTEFCRLYSKKDQMNIESYCYEKVAEALEKIRPKSILVVGKSTLKLLIENETFLPITIEKIGYGKYGKSRQMDWCIARWKDIPIFCVRHLSRAPPSNQSQEIVKQKFNDFLKINKIC
ncbi:MAG: hypothetical protein D9C04_05065 [Nitrosopumilus sp. B06]|nr:MAG: hypothetical protein D9C04_05065 [Nitrosopumilus sp. B06]